MSMPADVSSILEEGGTILGTDNTCDPFHDPEGGMAGGADVILLPETGSRSMQWPASAGPAKRAASQC